MSTDPSLPVPVAKYGTSEANDESVDQVRMSFGEHLEELRSCLIRALAGVTIATVLGFIFGKQIMGVLFYPLVMVQHANQLQPNLQALSPTTAFAAYLKVAVLSGLILAMPWTLYQLWQFVAAGLYARERRFAEKLIWPSVVLFVVGVLFLYSVVLPIMLQFFIRFNRTLSMPDLSPLVIQTWLVPQPAADPAPEQAVDRQKVPVVREDPVNAEVGAVWINESTGRFVAETPSGRRSVALEPGAKASLIQSQFTVDAYISFVLTLALAFGVAFETPIVVFFLAWTGVVSTETMVRSRRYVLLAVVVAAAFITPTPDLISQLLLAGPMYLLFELGVFAARLSERKSKTPIT